MKLLEKTSRIYLLVSLIIYLATAIAFYWIIKFMIYDEVESRLMVEKRDFESYVIAHNAWTGGNYFVENKIEVKPGPPGLAGSIVFKDTLIRDRYEGGSDPFRQLTFFTRIGGVNHQVSIRKSLIQSYKLIEVISLTMFTFLGLLMICMFVFQRRLSEKLWQPFYDTLARIKGFDWTREEPVELSYKEITEFNELNDVLTKMADKMQYDYKSLKEFTENASHEIQTPLALINARVEQFIQSDNLTEKQTYWLEEIYHASGRMSKLHQGLILLARIENHQFTDLQEVDLTGLLSNKVQDFEDILSHREITVEWEGSGRLLKTMSHALADILLTNLLNNAIRHNNNGGRIMISCGEQFLRISNSGNELINPSDQLFKRFKKESSRSDSLGLGLAIVKQICDTYELSVEYTYADLLHSIWLSDQIGRENV